MSPFDFTVFARVSLDTMEMLKNFLYLIAIFWWPAASAQDLQPTTPEVTTEILDLPTFEPVTEISNDNVTLKPEAVEGKEEEPLAVEEQPVLTFPENHKNFTPNQYLGNEEFPPYYGHLNPYQQQYKNYFEQKQIYNRKPIKFEENSLKNFYLQTLPNALDLRDEKKKENFRVNRWPFPYAFDHEKTHELENWNKNIGHVPMQEQAKWHKNVGHAPVHEEPENQHVFSGHQESIGPYVVFPQDHSHEEHFYKNKPFYYEHRHVTKDEKENPWKKVFHVLTALVPLGLLLATLTPNVISVNSTATTKTVRQRSEDSLPIKFKEDDVLKLMKKHGMASLSEEQCEDRIICDLAREGAQKTDGSIEQGFWFLANQTPWDIAEKAGMSELFKAIKTGNCEVFKCRPKTESERSSGKKLIRKRKVVK